LGSLLKGKARNSGGGVYREKGSGKRQNLEMKNSFKAKKSSNFSAREITKKGKKKDLQRKRKASENSTGKRGLFLGGKNRRPQKKLWGKSGKEAGEKGPPLVVKIGNAQDTADTIQGLGGYRGKSVEEGKNWRGLQFASKAGQARTRPGKRTTNQDRRVGGGEREINGAS